MNNCRPGDEIVVVGGYFDGSSGVVKSVYPNGSFLVELRWEDLMFPLNLETFQLRPANKS
jgi:hypothetical protein